LTALGRASLVYCDNVNAMYLSTDPVQHQRTKHVAIDLHFVRNQVAIGDIRVLHVPSTSQFADIFTKGLLSSTFSEFRYGQWLVVVAGGPVCVRLFLCRPVLYSMYNYYIAHPSRVGITHRNYLFLHHILVKVS
jgi:hypothetical protein